MYLDNDFHTYKYFLTGIYEEGERNLDIQQWKQELLEEDEILKA